MTRPTAGADITSQPLDFYGGVISGVHLRKSSASRAGSSVLIIPNAIRSAFRAYPYDVRFMID